MPIYELEIQGRQFEVEAPNTEALKAAVPRIMSQAGLGTGTPAEDRAYRMTVDIKAPNGDTVQFPDGTPDNVILDVMRREYGGPEAPAATNQVPAEPETWGGYLRGLGREAVQSATFDFADELGLTDADASKKFAAAHPVASTVARVVGGVAPFVAGPGAALARAAVAAPRMLGLTGNVARSAALGAGTGAVSGLGAGEGGLVDRLDEAATGAGVGALAGAVAPPVAAAAGRVVNRVLPARQVQGPPAPPTAGQEAVLAAERLNAGSGSIARATADNAVNVPRAMATDNRVLQQAGGVSQRLPFGSPIEGAAERTTTALGEAADRVARGYGSTAGALHAGDAAKQGMLEWIKGGSRAIDQRLYGEVERLINPNVTAPLSETRVAAMHLAHEMAESGTRAAQSAIDIVADAISRPNGLTWRGAQQLRTELGARLSGKVLPEPGTSMPALQYLRDALTIDMGRIARAAGGTRAEAAWRRADEVHTLISERRTALAKIIGAKGEESPEAVFDRLVSMARSGRGEDFQRLMDAKRAMGAAAWNEVPANAVARLGRAPNGDFSPARFVSDYGKLTPNGRAALFGTGGLRRALDDIATVSERFRDTMTRYSNPSGTGRAMVQLGALTGTFTMPLETLAIGVSGYTMARWLANPVTADAVRGVMQAQLQAATRPGPAATILVQQATQKLFATAGREGMPAEPPNAVPASAPARAASPAQPAPAPQQDLASNQTVQALLAKGVHPTNARQAVGNPQLAMSMLRSPQLYAEPGTPAERIIAHRRAEGSAVGGAW